MKTADLRGRRDAGEIIGHSYRLYARNFLPLFALGLTYLPVQMLIAVVQGNDASPAGGIAAIILVAQLAAALVTVVASGAVIAAVHEITDGQPASFGRALDAAFDRAVPLITTNLLFNILGLTSLLAFPYTAVRWWRDVLPRERVGGPLAPVGIVVGALLYFFVRWIFQAQTVMLEGRMNWAALDASALLTRGAWWRTLGVMLLIMLIALGPMIIAASGAALPPLAAATILGLAFALVFPFIIMAQTLLYYDLKARMPHDNLDLPAA